MLSAETPEIITNESLLLVTFGGIAQSMAQSPLHGYGFNGAS